ncbi:VWA domain-containing protein [Streptomyces sp. NPDC007164]|uniref:VWA domain-containing protein n=1 Tax=Streptomyces sp. NPDC007164 TaxID=3156918 RepID=UPI0033F5C302
MSKVSGWVEGARVKARDRFRGAVAAAWIGGAPLALVAGATPAVAAPPGGAAAGPEPSGADRNGGLVMVLDSSGSMADDDGTGRSRMESARTAVGTVVDGLPDGYPTGLRVYGADRARGCTDTRLVRPVRGLDRVALKRAVAAVRPRGDTPIGLSLRKAAQDLPRPSVGAVGTRTVLLVSDGEDNCGAPGPCEVAEQLGKEVPGLRRVVRGAAREQLECVAAAGNGRYYDAPDADSLARQLQRASQLSADGYRFRGERVAGTATGAEAPVLVPGQYLDTIGPGEKRYYAVDLDDVSTADFSVTAAPQAGAAVDTFDAMRTSIAYGADNSCGSETALSPEGGGDPADLGDRPRPLGAGRGPLRPGGAVLAGDRAGEQEGLRRRALAARTRPRGGAAPEGGRRARPVAAGVRQGRRGGRAALDRILPAQTRWYKVPAGWGQQVRYDVEFANEPMVERGGSTYSYGATQLFTPARFPLTGGGEFTPRRRCTAAGRRRSGWAAYRSPGPTATKTPPRSGPCTPEATSTSR